MPVALPEHLDPWRSADRGAAFDGELNLGALTRLAGLLVRDDGKVGYRFRFERDERGRAVVLGSVNALLIVECQRCLKPLTVPVAAELHLVAVRTLDEATALPDEVDPLLVDSDDWFRPIQLIEEELLLALPQIPLHATGECQVPAYSEGNSTAGSDRSRQHREGPFAALATREKSTEH